MKRIAIIVVAAFILGMLINALMPQAVLGAGKGSERKGKFYYKKLCKTCHGKDGKGGELTPISKTQAQWEEFFKTGKHQDKNLTDIVSEDKIIHIKTFLIHHAADSDQPETCG